AATSPPSTIRGQPGGTQPGTAKTRGFGGFPNDCCQDCGRYLHTACYSEQDAQERVPRTNKICMLCYAKLPLSQRASYRRYIYKHGHEAKGTGWNPKKPR